MCCGCLNRREFLGLAAGVLGGAAVAPADSPSGPRGAIRWDPDEPFRFHARPLRIRPVLMYATPRRREQTSWKSWGGIQTDEAARAEAERIAGELRSLASEEGGTLEILPVVCAKTAAEVEAARRPEGDAVIVYAATGGSGLLEACLAAAGDAIIFVRHRSGPVYYWYEALSTRLLSANGLDKRDSSPHRASVHDVVVDDYGELGAKLRALRAVRNLAGTRIVALGGVWGKYSPEAPERAREKFRLDIVDVPYERVEARIRAAVGDAERQAEARSWAERYLSMSGTKLETARPFVVNAFVLYRVFREIMAEHSAPAFTIKSCMGTIMPLSQTTACLTLSLLNDEGWMAFCESDFVVIPAGMLLYYVARRPVFLHNSTFPHKGLVTCAHCTGPRRMDGRRYESVRIVTHYESEYGAAPKVEMPVGQEVTFIDPEYSTDRWVGFKGIVRDNPFYDICRSQQDVEIVGRWKRLIREVRDSHWLMAYGDWREEVGYAARKLGIRWEDVSEVEA